MMRIIAGLAMAASLSAHAAWQVESQKDQMTDEKRRFAKVASKTAVFYIYESGPHDYTGALQPLGRFDMIHFEPKHLMLRVDRNPAVRAEFSSWEPGVVFVSIPRTFIDQLVAGQAFRVQYPKSANTTTVEVFSLAGAAKTIKTALPSYRTPSQRTESLKKVEAQIGREMAERERRAQAECPDVWQKYQAAEARYGQPQMWQGCQATY